MYRGTFFDDEEERLFRRFYRDVSWRLIEEYVGKKKLKILEVSEKEGFWFVDLAKMKHHVTLIVKGKSNYRKAERLLNQANLSDKVKIFDIDFKHITKKEEIGKDFDVIIAERDVISTYPEYNTLLLDLFTLLKRKGIIIACFENRYYDIKKYIPDMNLDQLRDFLKTGNVYYIGKDNTFKFLYHAFTPEEVYDFFEKSGFNVLKIAGKIVLPWRLIKDYLKNPDYYDKLIDIEMELNEIPYLFGSAKQLLFIAQKIEKTKKSKKKKK